MYVDALLSYAHFLAIFALAWFLGRQWLLLRAGHAALELETLARKQAPAKKTRTSPPALPELADFQERLQEAVGVRAQITGDLHKGRIVLRYASFEELEGIYEAVNRLLQ